MDEQHVEVPAEKPAEKPVEATETPLQSETPAEPEVQQSNGPPAEASVEIPPEPPTQPLNGQQPPEPPTEQSLTPPIEQQPPASSLTPPLDPPREPSLTPPAEQQTPELSITPPLESPNGEPATTPTEARAESVEPMDITETIPPKVENPPTDALKRKPDVTATEDVEMEVEEILPPVEPEKARPAAPERDGNCYCGKERNLNIVELLCVYCQRWFHESCIGYQLGKLVPFMMNYVFICKNCSPTGLENFKKNQAQFTQMCVTAIANLVQASVKEGNPRTLFSKDVDIIPFIDAHWEGMTTMPRRVTQSWHSTIHKALVKDTGVLFRCEGAGEESQLYGFLSLELTQIKPNYESVMRGRNLKRKFPDHQTTFSKKRGVGPSSSGASGDASATKLPAHGYPLEHPYNKDGYRYILAEPDPHAPFRQEFDESSDWAGKPIPGWLYRMLNPSQVLLALHDRAPQSHVSEDRTALTGEKGYCMARGTHGVSRGSWYWEARVEEMPEGSASRIGWSQQYGNLQAPLGYDKFGYSWRSRKGTRFHESRGKSYSSGYGEGDILGFLIILPDSDEVDRLPPSYKDKPLVKFKSHLYYEEKDNVQETLRTMKPLKGSKLIFFRNGKCQGVAFEDVYGGTYYPAMSIYKNATVSVNFGPRFRHPPKEYTFKGMHERAEEGIVEQAMSDLLYLTENDGKLRLDTYYV